METTSPSSQGTPSPETAETTTTAGPAVGNVVDNASFMSAVFGELPGTQRPIVVGVKGRINAQTRWPAGDAWEPSLGIADANRNWYFTLSTFDPVDGCYRRRKPQFAQAFGVMLDDIGTKAAPRERLDACPPSYVIETSPGNFQAGYLFDEPCADLERIEALQEALVAAGLCDPGAKGPSARIGRLPVGHNGKYDPPHPCRLVEWQPQRRYSIDEIVERLQLTPAAKPESASKRRKRSLAEAIDANADGSDVHVPRSPENPVLQALRERGLYKRLIGPGRHDVTCPWVHEHTDQQDHGSAYFEPNELYALGGYKCQHGHCSGRHISALLDFLKVPADQARHKPTIRVTAGTLHLVVDSAERELAAAGGYYQRGGIIVSVQIDPGTGDTGIKPTSANGLTRVLSAIASWEKYDARHECFVAADPPARHVNCLFDADVFKHLPVLRGIARQPYLREDGSLMHRAGYDAHSGMFGAFAAGEFSIPNNPTRQQAEVALAQLESVLTEFSFATPHDRAAALGAMLTAAIRAALALAPMFHVKAPQIASGKSYLCSLVAAFAGPATPSAYAFPTTEEEAAKLMLAALMEAPAVLMFDNLTTDLTPFKSLCSALTEEHLTGRLLGYSKTSTVPTRTLMLSSGNNVGPVRDMTRRCVTITLDPKCETPASRTFKSDPLERVRAQRGRFVSLVLTIIRAYLCAGSPLQGYRSLGSYCAWSRLVRGPLMWLGLPDPAEAVFVGMAEDPDREILGRLMATWRQAFGMGRVAVRDLVRRATGWPDPDAELREVLHEIADERGEINRRRLGRWISRHEGVVVDGLRIERDAMKANGSEKWHLVVMGVSGVFSGPPHKSVTDMNSDVEVF
jgi:hypothetical protein